ncbi:MAG: ATP-binding cassette domain-containing protein [Acidimicrobiales bacterium]
MRPGRATSFLGPNGAGKTAAMRIILGTTRQTPGTALVGGRTYQAMMRPLHGSVHYLTPTPCILGAARGSTCWLSRGATASGSSESMPAACPQCSTLY